MEVPQSHLWVGGAQATRDANLERLWCMDTLTPSREVIVLEVR
jgi:hypothetical protein